MIDWQAVEAIGTVVGVVLLIAAGIFTLIQLNEARRARNAQLAFPIFSELRSEDMKKRLKQIYALSTTAVPSDMEKDISYVLDRLEFLGVLMVNGGRNGWKLNHSPLRN